MTLVFRTHPDDPHPTSISGVGEAGAHGKGGVLVEHAAEVLHELQADEKALTGAALKKAAKAFAEARGFVLSEEKEIEQAILRAEREGAPDPPPAAESAQADAAADQKQAAEYAGAEDAPPPVVGLDGTVVGGPDPTHKED